MNNISGKEIVFQVKYTPAKPMNNWSDKRLNEYKRNRQFYTCNQNEDYFDYTSRGKVKDIIQYAKNESKSSGIFGRNGDFTAKEISSIRRQLQTTESNIWHGFISFEEEFGNNFCGNYEQAKEFMTKNFDRFLKRTHLDVENVTWLASLHEDTDNKHLHFIFFENEPKTFRSNCDGLHYTHSGNINRAIIENAKTDFFKYFLNNEYLIYDERDAVLKKFKEIKYSKDENFMQKNSTTFIALLKLARALPNDGSLKYGSEQMQAFKPDIDAITDCILKSNEDLHNAFKSFISVVGKRDSAFREYMEKRDAKIRDGLIYDKCMKDMYSRLGNQIIQSAFYIKKCDEKNLQMMSLRRQRQHERKKKLSVWREYLHMLKNFEQDAYYFFNLHLKNLEKYQNENF